MKHFNTFVKECLTEALTPDQKAAVDLWKNRKTAPDISSVAMKGESTIRIPLPDDGEHVGKIPETVQSHLEKHGFSISSFGDYRAGYALDNHGRIVSIGKALNKTKASEEIKGHFENDPVRQAANKKELHVAITKDPYHVAGMSTDRGWTSCMHMNDGMNANYLMHDIQRGTHVAYLVHKDDKDIDRPIARIALKPFTNDEGHTILRPEDSVYGTANSKFHEVVNSWADQHFPMKEHSAYRKDRRVYNDSTDMIMPPLSRQNMVKTSKDLINAISNPMRRLEQAANQDHLRSIASRLHTEDLKELVDHIHTKNKDFDAKVEAFKGIRQAMYDKHHTVESAVFSHFLNSMSPDNQLRAMSTKIGHSDLIPKYAHLDIDKEKLIDHVSHPSEINFNVYESKKLSDKVLEKFGQSAGEFVALHNDTVNSMIDRDDYKPSSYSIPNSKAGMTKFIDKFPELVTKPNVKAAFMNSPEFDHDHAKKVWEIEGKAGEPQKYPNLRYENLNHDSFKNDPTFTSYVLNHVKDRRVVHAAIDHIEANPPIRPIVSANSALNHVDDPKISKFFTSSKHVDPNILSRSSFEIRNRHIVNAIHDPDISLSRKIDLHDLLHQFPDTPHAHILAAARGFKNTAYAHQAEAMADKYIRGDK